MKTWTATAIAFSGVLLVGGCASIPTAPSMMALPGTGKSFDQFRRDDSECRNYAFEQIGGKNAEQQAMDAGVRSATVGTVVGAVAGAAIGGSKGAGVGAGTGLVFGSVAGSGSAAQATYGSQRQYDNAYIQCMYARGQRVPVSGAMTQSLPQTTDTYPAPPPPPAGMPPPPPPGQ